MPAFRSARRALIALSFLIGPAVPVALCVSNSIVISQVYGAGGNSGSTLNQDYIELFNLGTTPVSINGWSLQYRSSAGTGAFTPAALPNVTIQPGQFYLVGASAPGTGTAVAVDFTPATLLNLSGSAGQVALSNSTVALTGCPTADPAIVDFVGYGTAATCSEGLAPTATLTATTSAIRKSACIDTDNNAADFTTATAAPRNSSTTFQLCGGAVQNFALASVAANPTVVNIGSTTLLTARVTPGTSPASTGIAVVVDLSGVGGSSTQPLYDDGTHGDATAGDNVFNYNATIGGTPTGTVSLKFTATDAQVHSATANASLTIQATGATVPIHTIQTNAPNTTYLNQVVTTTGVVIAIANGGFYLEARDADQDTDPNTSEGIFVVSGITSSVVVGNLLNVTGTVKLTSSTALTPATEIAGTVTMTVVSTGNALPTPVTITAANDSPTGGFSQFLKFQSMRFKVASFTTTAPTDGNLNETTETVTSTGEFWGVVTGVTRPIVEPGISVLEPSLPTGANPCTATVTTNCIPRFDGNPELMLVESTTLGGPAIDVTSNQIITNMLGIVDFNTATALFLLDKTAPGTLGAPMTFVPVPVAAANEFTIGSMNLERFYSDQPATGAATITTAAYQRRLAKASLLLRNVQRMPDIIGVQEMGTLTTLNDLSAKISADAIAASQPDPHYSTCLVQGNDPSGINTAFLVKTTRVTVVDCTQFGKSTTFINSTGASATLNDRPPLVLRAVVNITGYPAFPVTVISNHLRSLTNVDDTTNTGATVRLKREGQAEFLANLIQTYQATNDHVVVVGDLNAFPFSDGYVDSIGIIKGTPAANNTVVVGTSASYIPPSPTLIDTDSLIADPLQRYDYTYIGNAQVLDHIILSQNITAGAHIAYSHEDADFPLIQYNDATTPQRTSDHDGLVAYFPLLATGQTSSASLTPVSQSFGSIVVGSSSAAFPFVLTNTGNTSINITSITASGDFTKSSTTCGTALAPAATCSISVVFTPSVSGARTGNLTVNSTAISNSTLTSSLTGSGTPAGASVSLTPASAAFGSIPLGGASTAQTFTFSNTGAASATISSIAVTGDFSKTTTCGTSLAAASSCTVSVTFAPSATGARTGTLSITSSGSTSALVSTLSGTGLAQATLSPASAIFPATFLTIPSAAQAFTVTNTSGVAINFGTNAISITGAFSQTNNCGTTLAAAATCTVNVIFTPTVNGVASGTLTVTPTIGTTSTTLTSSLTGTGQSAPGFSLTPTVQTGSLTAGTSASLTYTVTPIGGYTANITSTCTGAPAGSVCTLTPASFALGANPINLTVFITTQKTGAGFTSAGGRSGLLALFLSFAVCGVLIKMRRMAARGIGLLGLLITLALGAAGCGAGGSVTTTTTTPGSYTYNISATDGTTTHTATYVLTVH